ncbi:excalibur calcium-binding domain-containing protein [Planococcus lenghuensis]|uniref:Excalibur calcium-binding domain-containing protein n=1 Tax=Planococcus lenghuensis TaxID=2213202 RepID=A0A1Q2KX55_9BACL|nr:excalibur calcium-binding domain-containing protein [Planococcus lenghuensis]AQQ52706.1 hypothetical protein B0X71_06065 [Planococcus lenghuensis]
MNKNDKGNEKDKNGSDKKNGCFGCIGCLGIIFLILLIFSACGAFTTEEEPEEEIETVAIEEEDSIEEAFEPEEEVMEEPVEEEPNPTVTTDSDRDCGYFATSEDLIAFWNENDYAADNDPHDLDVDEDGLPCEVTQDDYDRFLENKAAQTVEEPEVDEDKVTEEPGAVEEPEVVEEPIEEEPEVVEEPVEPEPEPTPSISYDNCTEVREAGADPIYAGDPGFGEHLDRDGDGVACE